MPIIIRWTITYSPNDRAEARVVMEEAAIIDFSVQYLAWIGGRWYPVVRFDTAHGSPHIDSSNPDGSSSRIDLAPGLDYRAAFNIAINDISQRWRQYREEFERRMSDG